MSDEEEQEVIETIEEEITEIVEEEKSVKEPSYVEVGGKNYLIVKTGRAQAEQVILLTKWIAKHGMPALQKAQTEQRSATTEVNGVQFIIEIIENLDADALIDLFVAAIGCSKEDAEVYFDIAILIDAVILIYNEQPAIKKLLDRFFSTSLST